MTIKEDAAIVEYITYQVGSENYKLALGRNVLLEMYVSLLLSMNGFHQMVQGKQWKLHKIVKLKTTILELVAIIAVGTNTTIHS
jgi:hypothetical protein